MTILFDGLAYGMLLFILSVGLSITLGLMNFINLAHSAFAMAGGYIAVILMKQYGVSFYWCLPAAFLITAAAGAFLEQTLYARLYNKSHLEQVLFTIGLTFMASATADYFMGSSPQLVEVPPSLQGNLTTGGFSFNKYRFFIILFCGLLTVALHTVITRTRFGSRLRASVDDARTARGMGIDVTVIFALTFAFGSGLAGLGGALISPVYSLDPGFPLKFTIYFLIVISVGGADTITGPFFASILLGIADTLGKYYAPAASGFIIYTIMVLVLIIRPQGLFGRGATR